MRPEGIIGYGIQKPCRIPQSQQDGDKDFDFVSIWTDGLKTIADARQLCRLLGVTLKE
jgi:hypothetical protein